MRCHIFVDIWWTVSTLVEKAQVKTDNVKILPYEENAKNSSG